MTDYLIFTGDNRIGFTPDGRLRFAGSPIDASCCPCEPQPPPDPWTPWAFGSCENLFTRRAVLTTPNLYFNWYTQNIEPPQELCSVDPPTTSVTSGSEIFDLSIAQVTTDNVDPVSGTFSGDFNTRHQGAGGVGTCSWLPYAFTPLPWYLRRSGAVSCEPMWESGIGEAHCEFGAEFRPGATGEFGVRVSVGTYVIGENFGDLSAWGMGFGECFSDALDLTGLKRWLSPSVAGIIQWFTAEAFIPASTGTTSWCRRTRFDNTIPFPMSPFVIENVPCPPFVISQG